jgi:hypothetical protein
VGRPWDRQPNESAKAFEAFAIYRDMSCQRSLASAAWKLHKSRTLLERWAAAHGWVQRVAAWDAYNDRESRNELEQQRRRAHLSRMEAFEQEGRRGRQSGMEEPVVKHARQALTQVLKVVSPEAAKRVRELLVEVSKHHAPP